MAASLYAVSQGGDPEYNDVNQYVDSLTAAADAGALSLLQPVSAPGSAPGVTLQAGSLTGTWKWGIYWITGILTGNGTARNVTGRTLAGPVTSGTSLASQEATVSISSFTVPTGVIGWGVVRNKSNGGTYYEVPSSEQFVTSYGGSIPTTFVDNTPDSSLVTAAPASNTTGTSISGVLSLLSGSSVAGTISGSATWSGAQTFGAGLQLSSGGGYFEDLATGGPGNNGRTIVEAKNDDFEVLNHNGSGYGGFAALTLTSYATTGTAPLSVASTTQVANLNAAHAGDLGGTLEFEVANFFSGTGQSTANVGSTSGEMWLASGASSGTWYQSSAACKIGLVSSAASYYFEAVLSIASGTVTAALYDETAAAVVTSSEVSTTSSSPTLLRSSAVTLTAGHVYHVVSQWVTNSASHVFTARVLGQV